MAINYTELFEELTANGCLIWRDSVMKAGVTTARTAQQTFQSQVNESTTRLPEHAGMSLSGDSVYEAEIAGYGAVQDQAASFAAGAWVAYAARYIRENDSSSEGIQATLPDVAQALVQNMLDDTNEVDASVPSVSAVRYQENNQGDGTATIVVNSDSTLAELPLAGTVMLRCIAAGFSIQNEERWRLEWKGTSPRTGLEITRYSQSKDFKTGTRYFDVAASFNPGIGLSPSARFQIPQRGGSIHTGLNILISAASYASPGETGDVDSAFATYSVMTKVGTKTNCTRRNTTYVWHTSNPNGTIYLRVVKDGSNYNCTWYQDTNLTVALTETKVFTAATSGTQSWLAAATNPEVFLPGGHLTTSDYFISAVVTGSSLTQSAQITLTVNLPWAVGDVISCEVTNAYGGLVERFFVEELGFALPANSSSTEEIADPSA